MKKNSIYIILVFVVLFTSCVFSPKKPELIEVELSPSLKKKKPLVELTVADNYLYLNYNLSLPADWKFPSDKIDTFFYTSFHYKISSKNKVLQLHPQFAKYNQAGGLYFPTSQFEFVDSAINLQSKRYSANFKVPLFLLYKLKEGANIIDVEIYQKCFYSKKSNDTTISEMRILQERKLFAKYQKTFIMPAIYQSNIYCNGIELKESRGKDFSLINEGNADIFWQIEFPERFNYFTSEVSKNSKEYTIPDTVAILHYNPNDIIRISVWDYDMLSRNDFMGQWKGAINETYTKNGKTKQFSSEEIKYMRFRGELKGKIN